MVEISTPFIDNPSQRHYNYLMKKDRIIKKCLICDKNFETRPYLVEKRKKGKYCSLNCYWKAKVGSRRNTVRLKCGECGVEMLKNLYHLKRGEGKYCSMKCIGTANARLRSGKNHWNWKGGISPRVLSSKKYKKWRLAVFQRDKFKCVWCGYDKGRILEADHIKSWKNYPKLRYKVSNGRALCRPCHIKTDTWGGKMNSNK